MTAAELRRMADWAAQNTISPLHFETREEFEQFSAQQREAGLVILSPEDVGLSPDEFPGDFYIIGRDGIVELPHADHDPTLISQGGFPMSDIMPYNRVIGVLLANPDARQAVLYLSPRRTVKATRRHKYSKRQTRVEILVTDGVPNYRERERIKKLAKDKRGFPVEEIEVR